jgi:glutamate--cysteine ligase catalytic subunit
MLGCKNFTWPSYACTPDSGITRSLFFCDQAIYPAHPRYSYLTKNIRERRKAKVAMNLPIFVDENTARPFIEDLNEYNDDADNDKTESKLAAKPDHVYLDAMGFGMGCCCLQMTFQAQSIDEAKLLYDQLTPLTPILLALSASSPIWRGFLTDIDCRWNIISGACDDRTLEEQGKVPLKDDKFVIPKSRYASIDCYLSEENQSYNDIPLQKFDNLFELLISNGIDSSLANHIAHLFIRDPLVLFKEKIDITDETDTDHFENIQSTNWQTMRFKPPPINSSIGWRVEFRPTELQITDFENAAFVTFLVLMTRVILSFKLNMLMPISKVEVNMETAQKRNACLDEKFHFRKNIFDHQSNNNNENNNKESLTEEMSINEIVNGSDSFPGCIPLIKDYLSNLDIDVDTQCTIRQYLQLIQGRASGKLLTTASWMRKFVLNHPDYKKDSRITDKINYDLMWRIHLISSGQIKSNDLHFPYETKSNIE